MMQLSREERMLDVKSMTNVRDLGGYETQTGFYTKSHKFIRSTNPSKLSDDEKEALKTTAQAFDDRLKGGEDMETVASAAGLTAQTATFDSESTSPDKDLIAAADALTNAGDVTDIIETENGIYIAKLTSLLDREATDSKKESIVSERKQEQYDSLLKQWKKDTKIKEEKKVWKKISFEEQGVTIKTSDTSDTSDSQN